MMLEDGTARPPWRFQYRVTVFLLMRLSRERIYYGICSTSIGRRARSRSLATERAHPRWRVTWDGGFAEHGIPTEGDAGGLSVRLICKAGEGVLARLGRVNGEFQMSLRAPPSRNLPAKKCSSDLTNAAFPSGRTHS